MNASILIRLSDIGRKIDILAGGNGEKHPTITVPPDAPEFREVVLAGAIAGPGIVLDCRYPHIVPGLPPWDAMPTAREVLDAVAATAAAKQAEESRQVQARRDATIAVLAERRTTHRHDTACRHCVNVGYDYDVADWPSRTDPEVRNSPEAVAWEADLIAARDAAKAGAEVELAAKIEAGELEKAAKAAAEKARRESRGLREGDDDFRTAGGALEQVPCFQSHKRGKNWLATITVDPSKPGGLARDFATKAHGDSYYIVPAWEPGDATEFGADYYSGAGRKSADRWHGYVVRIEPEYVVLHKCGTGKSAVEEGKKFAATLASAATK